MHWDFPGGPVAPKSTVDGDNSQEIKRHLLLWKESYDKPGQHIEKQRHHFADKGVYSQSHGFSSSHVQTWKLDTKKSEELMLLYCGAGEDSWEFLGLWEDQISQS